MIIGSLTTNDANTQSFKFKFNFSTQIDKLNIQALSQKDNLLYVGEIAANHNVDFQDIQEIINKGQFKVLTHNEQMLKIKAGPIRIELAPAIKLQMKELRQQMSNFLEKQNEMQSLIDMQKTKIINHQVIINDTFAVIKELSEKVEHLQKSLQQTRLQIQKNKNPQIEKIDKQVSQIEEINWSTKLRSKKIKIDGNAVTFAKQAENDQFCLLGVSFLKQFRKKQAWTLKINKLVDRIFLGICLKSMIQQYNFVNEDINWQEIGHGFYLIGSDEYCYSHTHKKLNDVQKSFYFIEGDVIRCEYDPIDWKLSFIKNDVEHFEMPLMAPQQNEQYCPVIEISTITQSVELI